MLSWIKKAIYDLEFSKGITVLVSLTWAISILINFAALLFLHVDLTAVLNYVQAAFLTIIGAYYGKAGFENIAKIKCQCPVCTTTDTPEVTNDKPVENNEGNGSI